MKSIVSVFTTGMFGVIVVMLLLGTLSATINSASTSLLTNSGVALAFLVAVGAILTKIR